MNPAASTIRLVIFDYDGVIADSLSLCLEAAEKAARLLGRPTRLDADIWDRLPRVTFDDLATELGFRGDEVNAFSRYIFNYTQAPGDWPRLFPGIESLLLQLSDRLPLQILSASSSRAIGNVLRNEGLIHTIRAISGGDQVGSKTEKLRRILQQADCAPEQALMVGDSISDIEAARACGVRAVAVSWGWQPLSRLRAAEPDFMIDRPLQLLEICRPGATEGCQLSGSRSGFSRDRHAVSEDQC